MKMDSSKRRAGGGARRAGLIGYVWTLGVLGCANGVTGIGSSGEPAHESQSPEVAGAPSGETEPDPWCLARSVLENNCQRCHGDPPAHGAPFSLVSFDDTQVLNKRGRPRFELIAEAVSGERMPPVYLTLEPEVAALDELQRASLLAWCDAGGPAPSAPCD